jgi:signal transduction histidine kinase
VHRMITAHGSEVTIRSEEGKGTTVSFWLQAAEESATDEDQLP